MIAIVGWIFLISGAIGGPQPDAVRSTSGFYDQVKYLAEEQSAEHEEVFPDFLEPTNRIVHAEDHAFNLDEVHRPFLSREPTNRIVTGENNPFELDEERRSPTPLEPANRIVPAEENTFDLDEERRSLTSLGNLNPLMKPLGLGLMPSNHTMPRGNFITNHTPFSKKNEFTGPVGENRAWASTIGGFVALKVTTIQEICGCVGYTDCGCCVGYAFKPIGIRNNVCVNASLSNDVRSSSQFMIHGKIYWDKYKLIDLSVSEKEPPTICLNVIPMFSSLQVCMQLHDVHYDQEDSMLCTCVRFSAHVSENSSPLMMLSPQCCCIGKPVPENRKQGMMSALLAKLPGMLIGVRNFLPMAAPLLGLPNPMSLLNLQ